MPFADKIISLALLLALLVSNCAGSFARRLTGSLALTAAALCSGAFEICLVDGDDMLHWKDLQKKDCNNYTTLSDTFQ